MSALNQTRYPELLADIAAKFEAAFADIGVDAATAKTAAARAAEVIRHEWGGQQVYIQVGTSFEVDKRRQIVGERWNGTNTVELCRELGISEMRLRQLYAEYQRSRNGNLF